MRRRPHDPTVPAYLPPWPALWPDTEAEARRIVRATQPRTAAAGGVRQILGLFALAAAVLTLITLPIYIAVPLIATVAIGVVGAQDRSRRRHRERTH